MPTVQKLYVLFINIIFCFNKTKYYQVELVLALYQVTVTNHVDEVISQWKRYKHFSHEPKISFIQFRDYLAFRCLFHQTTALIVYLNVGITKFKKLREIYHYSFLQCYFNFKPQLFLSNKLL